jgi:hypothetical protein
MDEKEFLWGYLVELRKELTERQKIRIQVIYFKITFISAVGLIITKLILSDALQTNIGSYKNTLLVIPAFGAIFFDFVLNSYNFAIKRIGLYIRYSLEVRLKSLCNIDSTKLWEEFLDNKDYRNPLASRGNFGLTLLTVLISIIALFFPYHPLISTVLIAILFVLSIADIMAFKKPANLERKIKADKSR